MIFMIKPTTTIVSILGIIFIIIIISSSSSGSSGRLKCIVTFLNKHDAKLYT